MSLDERRLPQQWKSAAVTPIYKKDKKTIAGNYRPVSLTCVPCKVLENMIREKILDHLEKHGFENVNQHGFTKVKSCLINLLETLEDVTSIVDEGNSVDMTLCHTGG